MVKYDPNMGGMGLDEATLNITAYLEENKIEKEEEVYNLCKEIRNQVQIQTGLTCSCGIGANIMLAKVF